MGCGERERGSGAGPVAQLHHFNPDMDHESLPTIVADLRERGASCDGLLISSPEYAHGIPGSLKMCSTGLLAAQILPVSLWRSSIPLNGRFMTTPNIAKFWRRWPPGRSETHPLPCRF